MTAPALHLGKADRLIINDVLYEVVGRDTVGLTLRTMAPPPHTVTKTHEEVLKLYVERSLRIVRGDIEDLPLGVATNIGKALEEFRPEYVDEALRRIEYCLAMDRYHARGVASKTIEGYARVARVVARYRRRRAIVVDGRRADTVPLESVSGSGMRDWYRRWAKSGEDAAGLVPLHDRKGKPEQRLDPEVAMIVANRISGNYLSLERPPMTLVHDLIKGDVEAANVGRANKLEVPSIDTVRRWCGRNVSEYERVYCRRGPKEAARRFGHVRRAPQASRRLEMVEVDHTPLDILLLHEDGSPSRGDGRKNRERKTLRVWLTVAIDSATRMIVGWHISPDRPCWVSVMSCLRMAILPKDFSEYGCRSPHPVFGVPEIVKLDNGKEFHSRSLKAAAAQLRMEVRWTPRGKPHLKGKVERVFGTINRDFLAFLPGRTFRDVRERGDYPSQARACFTLPELQALFAEWVVDVYHNRTHSGLMGRTPLQRWEDLRATHVRVPPTAEELFSVLALAIDRTVTNEGVTFLGLTFNSNELQAMRRKKGHLGKIYGVKVDPLDLGEVLVLDEDKGRWLAVPCLHPELSQGVSVVEWRDTVALARKRTREGSRVPMQRLREARRDLEAEARRKGAPRPRVTRAEVDQYARNPDDPHFDLAPLDGTEADEAAHRAEEGRRRGRKRRKPDASSAESGGGGEAAPPRVGGGEPQPEPSETPGDDEDDDGDDELQAVID